MATIPDVDAVRIMFDLVKDREVTSTTPYTNADKLGATETLKYGEAVYAAYPQFQPLYGVGHPQEGQRKTWADATNDERAITTIKALRSYLRDLYVSFKGNDAAQTAGASARTAAQTEVDTDLGTT